MTPYETSARYYDDAYAAKQDLVDLPFYLDLARRVGGPVLELACGTGRVLLPIAREGIAIHGVDSSPPMLEVLRAKLQREPAQVRDLVSVAQADMRTFRSGKRYPLVLIPFRPMQHMFTVEDQLAALTTAALHLRDDGLLAFDVFFPIFDLIEAGVGEERLELEWPDATNPGRVVRRHFRKDSVDRVNQSFSATWIFRTYDGGKLVSDETEPLRMSYYTYPHLRALFMLAGLEIVEEFGSFDPTALDNSAEQMIFLLRARAPAPQ